jgi:calcineurin-like phosphoesterase family protein
MNPLLSRLDDIKDRISRDLPPLLRKAGVFDYLQACEYLVIEALIKNGMWQGAPPANPGGQGSSLFGLVPYWVHHSPQFIRDYSSAHPGFAALWDVLKVSLPARIDTTNYQVLLRKAHTGGVVIADGGVVGKGTYEGLDPEWLWTLVDYSVVLLGDRTPFGIDPQTVTLAGSSAGQVTIAVVGDWGTGSYDGHPAQLIMERIAALRPDYIIHLGDVYYAGTTGDFLPLDEEIHNYLNLWPPTATQAAGTSFMLNSNHEMYSGAEGYFRALGDTRFSAQHGTSYFALKYGDWTILGLDTAYYDTSALFMNGSLGGKSNQTQTRWIMGLKVPAPKAIIMTHHNGLNYDGSSGDATASLWSEINAALGGKDPAAWYWGHIHNGVAYRSPTGTGSRTLARCVGHGAFPFGDAWGMNEQKPVLYDYYSHTPNPASAPLVYNGFMLLTISSAGHVTEQFFEQNNPHVVFTNSF